MLTELHPKENLTPKKEKEIFQRVRTSEKKLPKRVCTSEREHNKTLRRGRTLEETYNKAPQRGCTSEGDSHKTL